MAGIPIACNVSNYHWSVSGTTFQNWLPQDPGNQTANPPIPANPQASFYDPGSGVITNPTYHWYWNDLGPTSTTETISCSARVTPPAEDGSPFTVTATQNVTVYVPALSGLNNQVGMGYIRTTQENNVTDTEMIALQPGNPPAGNGSIWTARVSLPPTPAFASGGQWGYVQLVTPEEYLTVGGQQITSKNTLKGEGLDDQFPYNGDTFSPDVRLDTDGDAPNISGLSSGIKNVKTTSSFRTYLMFQPPANSSNDVKWVPLAESLWTINFNASLDPYNNSPYSAWTDYPATQSVGQVALGYNFVAQNSFPTWSQIVPTNDSF